MNDPWAEWDAKKRTLPQSAFLNLGKVKVTIGLELPEGWTWDAENRVYRYSEGSLEVTCHRSGRYFCFRVRDDSWVGGDHGYCDNARFFEVLAEHPAFYKELRDACSKS